MQFWCCSCKARDKNDHGKITKFIIKFKPQLFFYPACTLSSVRCWRETSRSHGIWICSISIEYILWSVQKIENAVIRIAVKTSPENCERKIRQHNADVFRQGWHFGGSWTNLCVSALYLCSKASNQNQQRLESSSLYPSTLTLHACWLRSLSPITEYLYAKGLRSLVAYTHLQFL